MGFLKFLKREPKKDDTANLDIPPTPPPMDDMDSMPNDFADSDIPHDFPEFDMGKEDLEMPKLDFPEDEPKIEPHDIENLPDTYFPEISVQQPAEIPKMSELPKVELAAPMQNQAQIKPSILMKPDKKPQAQERSRDFNEVSTGKSLFMRIDHFKLTLGNINIVRNDLKKAEDSLTKLENMKYSTDKSFEKIRSSFEDLQKKIVYMDRTLFKGD